MRRLWFEIRQTIAQKLITVAWDVMPDGREKDVWAVALSYAAKELIKDDASVE